MKTAIVVSAQATAFESLALSQDLDRSFELIASLGFSGVEIAIRDPDKVDADHIHGLAQESGLQIAAIGTGQAYVDEGLSLTHLDGEVREKAMARMRKQLALGQRLGAMVIIGLIRGMPRPGEDIEQAMKTLAEALQELSSYASSVNAPGLLLEPLNRYEARLINSIEQGAAFLKTLSRPNVWLLADTFHMNLEDRDMAGSIRRAAEYIGHVHLADSNRQAPGQGHTDFMPIIEALRDIGYHGYLSAEILPLPTPEEAVRLTAKFIAGLNILRG